ncbi:MAG: methylated-DNA--[protein]-cysteine S-methyltransferase [Acidobacteria bacterium]|nr:methylated-DNA--[protein]-cysteine S-methyltransferase [Acidobacteriota bacterium]
MTELHYDDFTSPIGTILIVCREDALCGLDYGDYSTRMHELIHSRFGEVVLTRRNDSNGYSGLLQAYFGGDFGALEAIRLDERGTPFQCRVWKALRSIPPGKTASYGEIAARLGAPAAARAVGLANSHNPVAIVTPCHRVIGSNGSLTGYAGGLGRKLWLLRHEGALPARSVRARSRKPSMVVT